MARTDEQFYNENGVIKPTTGGNFLLTGLNRFFNFGSISGVSGYGFRDNAGVLEFKDSGGSWVAFNSLGGGAGSETFETVSKNLKAYPYIINRNVQGQVTDIVYDLPGANIITKTLNYTSGILTSMVLSDNTPSGIALTKTFTYVGQDIEITYS